MSTRTSMAKTNKKFGTPGGSRTPSLMIRSHILYPIELRVLYILFCFKELFFEILLDSRTKVH